MEDLSNTAVALYDFAARDDDELTFYTDDILYILPDDGHSEDEGWWYAKKGNKYGLIPSNYVCMNFQTQKNATKEVLSDNEEATTPSIKRNNNTRCPFNCLLHDFLI